MSDDDIHATINRLVEEEHHLRSQTDHTDDQRSQLAQIEDSLDQCWDLLRQRDALRAAGRDAGEAQARPVSEVEGYLQ
jgi:phage tail sheath gpL-like